MSLDLTACYGAKSTVEMTPLKKMVVASLLPPVPKSTPLGLVVKIVGRRCCRQDLEETPIEAGEDDFGRRGRRCRCRCMQLPASVACGRGRSSINSSSPLIWMEWIVRLSARWRWVTGAEGYACCNCRNGDGDVDRRLGLAGSERGELHHCFAGFRSSIMLAVGGCRTAAMMKMIEHRNWCSGSAQTLAYVASSYLQGRCCRIFGRNLLGFFACGLRGSWRDGYRPGARGPATVSAVGRYRVVSER
ncbi:hypothetical protein ACLOJK_028084 [Asimina triloba]